jgi:flagellar motor switch protein FliM
MTATETPASDTICQSEIENLLSQFGGGGAQGPNPVPAEFKDSPAQTRSGKHEFQKLSFFSPLALRKLRLRHEELLRYIGAQLASYLRLETVMQMSKLETMPFQKFIDGLSDPTHLTMFNLAPLRGVCLLDIPPRIGLCLVDRQLGGPALKVDTSRNLSEIENRLISRVAELILSEWCSYWSSIIDLRSDIIGHEGNGRFAQTSSPETTMLVIGITTWVGGEIVDEMQLAFPHYALEPLVNKLTPPAQNDQPHNSPSTSAARWNPDLNDLKIPLRAEFPSVPFSARNIAQLKVGDFIPLQPEVSGQVIIRLGGLPKFHGQLGTANEHRAVKINRPHKNQGVERLS